MGCFTFVIGTSAVVCLALGYLSVFSTTPRARFRCALGYVLIQTLASVVALFDRGEFNRLIDAFIISTSMTPVVLLWLVVLKKRNDRDMVRNNVERLSKLVKSQTDQSKELAGAKK